MQLANKDWVFDSEQTVNNIIPSDKDTHLRWVHLLFTQYYLDQAYLTVIRKPLEMPTILKNGLFQLFQRCIVLFLDIFHSFEAEWTNRLLTLKKDVF